MRTLDEFRKERPLQAAPRSANLGNMQMIAHEAVRLEALTGDPDWDHFLAYFEAALKMATRMRDQEMTRLRDPGLVNPDDVAKLRANLLRLDARIDTLSEVLMLPQLLKKQGELARLQIAEMTRDAREKNTA
jgi:hypothetical protein